MVAHPGSCCAPAARRIRRHAVVPGTARPPPAFAGAAPRSWPSSNDVRRKKRSSRSCGEVRRKMKALRRLVPAGGAGGGRLDADELLFRAAGYIVRLQAQVKAMQLMVDVMEHTTHP